MDFIYEVDFHFKFFVFERSPLRRTADGVRLCCSGLENRGKLN